jgi:hypothetical protein
MTTPDAMLILLLQRCHNVALIATKDSVHSANDQTPGASFIRKLTAAPALTKGHESTDTGKDARGRSLPTPARTLV